MSDDLVTRLRKAVAQTAEANTLPSWDFATVVWEAADEIERLRAEVDSADAVAYRSLKGLYDKQHEHISLLLEQRDKAWADYAKLKDTRIDLQAVENIVGSVRDVLSAARRQYDTSLIQNDLIASKDDEIERLTEWQKNALLALDKREAEIDGETA